MNSRVYLIYSLIFIVTPIICTAQGSDSKENGYTQTPQTNSTVRYCLTLDLKDDPKLIEEYEQWHQPENVWAEITEGIKKVGILDSEIYRSGTKLFMILTVPADFDFEKRMGTLAGLPRQAEWEEFMSKFQASDPNSSSAEKWVKMKRVFKLPPVSKE